MSKIYRPRHHSIETGSSSAKGEGQHGSSHVSVLLDEALTGLAIKEDGIYIDATFGRGGHSKEILKRLGPQGQVLAIDRDPEAIEVAKRIGDERLRVEHGSFTKLKSWISELGLAGKIDGVLLDLGVSSPQLDNPERGFSFLRDGPLDMRMDPTQGMDAAGWINSATKEEIATVLKTYGEERYSRRIADAIVKGRIIAPIATTGQLARIVADAHPKWEPHKHPATRTFQGIRIFINDELGQLKDCLEQCLDVLAVGGRMVAISFHSLEDRIVKNFIRKYTHGETMPRKLPVPTEQLVIRLKRIGCAIKASDDEIARNVRSRSANMRVAEKVA